MHLKEEKEQNTGSADRTVHILLGPLRDVTILTNYVSIKVSKADSTKFERVHYICWRGSIFFLEGKIYNENNLFIHF